MALRGGPAAPRGRSSSLRGEHMAPRGKVVAPRGEVVDPRGQHGTLKGRHRAAKGQHVALKVRHVALKVRPAALRGSVAMSEVRRMQVWGARLPHSRPHPARQLRRLGRDVGFRHGSPRPSGSLASRPRSRHCTPPPARCSRPPPSGGGRLPCCRSALDGSPLGSSRWGSLRRFPCSSRCRQPGPAFHLCSRRGALRGAGGFPGKRGGPRISAGTGGCACTGLRAAGRPSSCAAPRDCGGDAARTERSRPPPTAFDGARITGPCC
jgi:hypothetical protein